MGGVTLKCHAKMNNREHPGHGLAILLAVVVVVSLWGLWVTRPVRYEEEAMGVRNTRTGELCRWGLGDRPYCDSGDLLIRDRGVWRRLP